RPAPGPPRPVPPAVTVHIAAIVSSVPLQVTCPPTYCDVWLGRRAEFIALFAGFARIDIGLLSPAWARGVRAHRQRGGRGDREDGESREREHERDAALVCETDSSHRQDDRRGGRGPRGPAGAASGGGCRG